MNARDVARVFNVPVRLLATRRRGRLVAEVARLCECTEDTLCWAHRLNRDRIAAGYGHSQTPGLDRLEARIPLGDGWGELL